MTEWTTLISQLQPGAVFKTHDGILAVKSEYHMPNAQSECVLLASGEYAHFPEKNDTEVQEIPLALIKAAPDLLAAIEAVLRYISSHQVYDKDARGVLERAAYKAKGQAEQ